MVLRLYRTIFPKIFLLYYFLRHIVNISSPTTVSPKYSFYIHYNHKISFHIPIFYPLSIFYLLTIIRGRTIQGMNSA
jgi:hypothetical protein